MMTALVSAVAGVLIAMIAVAGQWLGSRNDRALTLQEIDVLSKLDPSSEAAGDLNWVIDRRIARWRSRHSPARTTARRVRWAFLYLFLVGGTALYASRGALVSALLLVGMFGCYVIARVKVLRALGSQLRIEAERDRRRDQRAMRSEREPVVPATPPAPVSASAQ